MTQTEIKNYPNVGQSIGITVIVILGMLVLSPLYVGLDYFISTEASMLIYYIAAIGIPFWIVFYIRKNKTIDKSFNWNIVNYKIIPLLIVVSVALLFGVINPIGSLIPMSESMKEVFMDIGSMTGVYAFLLLVVAAPLFEELIFRGIMLDGLLKKYSPVKSILISSFLFGIVHLNPWQFVTAFIIGLFIGWVYYHTRSLSLSVIIHAAVNLIAYSMMHIIDLDVAADKTLIESYGGLTYLILAIVGSIIIGSICVYLIHKEFNKNSINQKVS